MAPEDEELDREELQAMEYWRAYWPNCWRKRLTKVWLGEAEYGFIENATTDILDRMKLTRGHSWLFGFKFPQ